jgi:RHS repeat-associated protein
MKKILIFISVMTLVLFLWNGIALSAEQVYFYYNDPAGTPLAMSDASGNVVWRANYLPFGEEMIDVSTVQNNKMFVGKEKDSESGYLYFGARYLDPQAGRFTSVDSIGPVNTATGKIDKMLLSNPQMLNRYAYALNNPYRYFDPDGRKTTVIITYDTVKYSIGPLKFSWTFGSHAAVHVDNPKGVTTLYDPAGSIYNPKDEFGGPIRGSDDRFAGAEADLNAYKKAQEEGGGSQVKMFTFNTTPDQEATIATNIENDGGQSVPLCTYGVTNALQGVGVFKDINTTLNPGGLATQLQQLQNNSQ